MMFEGLLKIRSQVSYVKYGTAVRVQCTNGSFIELKVVVTLGRGVVIRLDLDHKGLHAKCSVAI